LTVAVARPTRGADEILAGEFAGSASALLDKLAWYRPQCIAFLGKAAYQGISGKRRVEWGEQQERMGGARVWILPNPSGLNRGFPLERLVEAYAALKRSL
jgi:TDG/mug DNA glycosylase family protein